MLVTSVTTCPDAVDVVVALEPGEPIRTSVNRRISRRALVLLPGLASHRCLNDDGRTFADELADTEVPHLFEHVVLELMALAGSPRDLRGETEWDFKRDGRGVFRLSLEYDDERVCAGAVEAARRVVQHAIEGGEAPDVAAEVERLRELREGA